MAHDQGDEARRPAGPGEDAKARFREALERKKAASHRTAEGSGGSGGVQGSGNAGPTQRTFRRRSGSS